MKFIGVNCNFTLPQRFIYVFSYKGLKTISCVLPAKKEELNISGIVAKRGILTIAV